MLRNVSGAAERALTESANPAEPATDHCVLSYLQNACSFIWRSTEIAKKKLFELMLAQLCLIEATLESPRKPRVRLLFSSFCKGAYLTFHY
jgi:hypothetical protein